MLILLCPYPNRPGSVTFNFQFGTFEKISGTFRPEFHVTLSHLLGATVSAS